LNYLLSINKKFLLSFSLAIISIFIISFSFNYLKSKKTNINKIIIKNNEPDITKPKFTINGNDQEIAITATKGNFLTKDEILLEKNVVFKSKKFKIFSDNVIFNKKNLVASSQNKSKFVSKNTVITSTGFDITDQGNIIYFKGRTLLILK